MFWFYLWLLAFRKQRDDEYVYVDGEAVPRKFFGKEKAK